MVLIADRDIFGDLRPCADLYLVARNNDRPNAQENGFAYTQLAVLYRDLNVLRDLGVCAQQTKTAIRNR
jgi:hypothetical protein